jgi:MFS family permease
MYLPGFFTGQLINRFGVMRMILFGLALLLIAGTIALGGVSLSRFMLAMGVLGLGWNFSFVGATALLTETYRPSERGLVQGFNELAVFGFVALAALLAGPVLKWGGWSGVNIALLPFVLACAALVLWLAFLERRSAAIESEKPSAGLARR